jgi:hypothetical protein
VAALTAPEVCPACESFGLATGIRGARYDYEGHKGVVFIRRAVNGNNG